MALTPRHVFRRYETDGVPSSGPHEPVKDEIITLLETDEARITDLEGAIQAGARAPFEPVQIATTGNITLSNEQTIDGVLTTTSRVLVKDQSNEANNGIYVTGPGAWTRAGDANTGAEIYLRSVLVESGSTQAGTVWQCSNTTPPALGSDDILFVKVRNTDQASSDVMNEVVDARGGFTSLSERLDSLGNADLVTSGLVIDYFALDTVEQGYINTSGAPSSNAAWRRTQMVPVALGQKFRFTGTGGGTIAAISYYNAAREWVATSGPITSADNVEFDVTDPTYAFIRASASATNPRALYVVQPVLDPTSLAYEIVEAVATGSVVDFFADPINEQVGYVRNDTGAMTISGNWRTTRAIPARAGQKFIYTGFASATANAVSMFDANLVYLGPALYSGGNYLYTNEPVTLTDPNVAYIRASARAQTGDTRSFLGVRAAGSTEDDSGGGLDVSYFNPEVVYGLTGDPLRLYLRNMISDRSVSVSCNVPRSNEEFVPIDNPSAGTRTVQVRARRGQESIIPFSFTLDIIDRNDIVSPPAPLNIIVIGDSTTEQYDDDGAMINELAGRLIGGSAKRIDTWSAFGWDGPPAPPSLGLSNIFFRGTRGSLPIKHEGRSAWRTIHYLELASRNGVPNAFWDGTQFSMDYYLEQNNFRAADIPTGVSPSGDNLLVIVKLGWNDVYRDDDSETGAASAANDMAALIDRIHAEKPDATVLVPGLNPAPRSVFKNFTTPRFVSQEEIFEFAIRAYGNAFRQVCQTRTNAFFHPVAATYDPEIAYGQSNLVRAFRSLATFQGAGDHVHSRPPGYAQDADAIFYWILKHFCT